MTPELVTNTRDTIITDPDTRAYLTTTYISKYLAQFDPICPGWKVSLVSDTAADG